MQRVLLIAALLVFHFFQSSALICGFGNDDDEVDVGGFDMFAVHCDDGVCAKVSAYQFIALMDSTFAFCAPKALQANISLVVGSTVAFCDTDYCNTGVSASKLPLVPPQETAISCFSGVALGGVMSTGGYETCHGSCMWIQSYWSFDILDDMLPVTTYACAPADFCSKLERVDKCGYPDYFKIHPVCCCDSDNCNDPHPHGVCPAGWQRSNVTAKCFYSIQDGADRYQSLVKCQEANQLSKLASVANAFENSEIADLFGSNIQSFRIGLSRKGNSWKWDDGSALNYTAWANGEPGNFDSVRIDRASRKWSTVNSTIPLPVVCELFLQ